MERFFLQVSIKWIKMLHVSSKFIKSNIYKLNSLFKCSVLILVKWNSYKIIILMSKNKPLEIWFTLPNAIESWMKFYCSNDIFQSHIYILFSCRIYCFKVYVRIVNDWYFKICKIKTKIICKYIEHNNRYTELYNRRIYLPLNKCDLGFW